jgi:signal peptidase II
LEDTHATIYALALVAAIIACVGCDQTTKSLARDHLQGRGTASFFDDTLRLQYAKNPGALLSLGASLPHRWRTVVFTVGAGAVLAAVLLYAFLAPTPGLVQIVALSLICSGGIGNLVDRVRYDGYVTDFLNIVCECEVPGFLSLAGPTFPAPVTTRYAGLPKTHVEIEREPASAGDRNRVERSLC